MKIIVPGKPQGKARARTVTRANRTHSYTPQKSIDYERLIAVSYKSQRGGYFAREPVNLIVAAFYPIPKSWTRLQIESALNGDTVPTTKPDCDNCLKIVADALNGVAYEDDKQIVSATITKHYCHSPRIEVTISPAWSHMKTINLSKR